MESKNPKGLEISNLFRFYNFFSRRKNFLPGLYYLAKRTAILLFVFFQFVASSGQTTFYSQGSGLFNLTTNWDTNPLGGGADPVGVDFTSGVNTFIIQDGHTITLNINLDVFNLTTGTGTSGMLTIGNGGARTVVIRNNFTVASGGTVNVGAFAAVHALSIAGNLIVDGTFDMR
ncbi:MAG: hypothetical protein MUF36_07750 [Bacteroidales bacterium]|nr:hypothetical protein [Bacteroidales bacterium]